MSPAAGPVEESPDTCPSEKAAEPDKEAGEKALPEPKAAAEQETPGQKSTSQAVVPPVKAGRESSLPTKASAVRPWRHQPLLSPAQPSDSSKDIVQAFISEIGIEATDLSSLLEQFEKSEAKKEEAPVQRLEDRRPMGSSGQEPLETACLAPLDYRTSIPNKATTRCSSPPTSVLLSPAASPCRDQEVQTPSAQPSHAAAKRYHRSRCSHSSSSHSSCGSCGRSQDRSSSSSSASSYSSRSTSRSQSRSPSPRRRSNRRRRYSYDAQDHYQRQRILQKERAIEERRVVFIGKIPSRMTRSELRHRFSVFGDIEECTLHFRSEGDNYGFVTYRYAEEAFAAIESGHKLRRPDEQPFDLCFGGRRQFCRRNYADLDSNREDFDPAPVKSKFDSLDFDTLLRQAQRSLRR
ncbi:PREDICTED: peroxisome proliferator-activated receptor gamma coactivator-related protein 1-like [Acanthisitta chloris]|uniref:peroxisome proliferator-activated receptor gamma coactivator-related protein 1-like n=1 Tax=Acanthisitta chloris TaxID=57068 RepID=UPI0004F0DFFE|nr:PREDICTED: peroxisome proliferator-activated receptor gamma coactivator-related protein 1-like [Acanthisitta chloris]